MLSYLYRYVNLNYGFTEYACNQFSICIVCCKCLNEMHASRNIELHRAGNKLKSVRHRIACRQYLNSRPGSKYCIQ